MIGFLHMHPRIAWALLVLVVLALAAVIGALFYHYVWRPVDLLGPADLDVSAVSGPSGRAGEPEYADAFPDLGEGWDDLDADTQAEQLIQEWHAGEERTATDDERCSVMIQAPPADMAPEARIEWWLGNVKLLAWDAKQQAARCGEILAEFPRLRAELGIAA